jgi:integrase
MKPIPGITIRHSRKCPAHKDREAFCVGKPTCTPTFQAHVWIARDEKRKRKTFTTLAEAKAWRQDALPAIRRGTMRASSTITLRAAWDAWHAGAKDGTIRNRSGDAFKPSTVRGYEEAMRLRVLDDLGALKLTDISRLTLQDLADRLLAEGLDPSTIRNTVMPLRALYRRAISRGEVVLNPTAGLSLPAVRGRRDRIASPAEAAELLAALDNERDRAVWAAAMYAGLRLGELRALRDEDVDLQAGVIRVERSWDKQEGVIEPKSRAGRRKVPIVGALRVHLAAHRLRRRGTGGLYFADENGQPFNRDHLAARAAKAWKETKLEPIGLHEARHSAASIFIAAGVNLKALSAYLGHASITITLDRYGHLMPGNEDAAVALVDSYLERETVRDNARQS